MDFQQVEYKESIYPGMGLGRGNRKVTYQHKIWDLKTVGGMKQRVKNSSDGELRLTFSGFSVGLNDLNTAVMA